MGPGVAPQPAPRDLRGKLCLPPPPCSPTCPVVIYYGGLYPSLWHFVRETHPLVTLVLRFLADKEHALSPIGKNEVVVPVQVDRREPVIGKGLKVFLSLGRIGGQRFEACRGQHVLLFSRRRATRNQDQKCRCTKDAQHRCNFPHNNPFLICSPPDSILAPSRLGAKCSWMGKNPR